MSRGAVLGRLPSGLTLPESKKPVRALQGQRHPYPEMRSLLWEGTGPDSQSRGVAAGTFQSLS